jgi:hypothetical protein
MALSRALFLFALTATIFSTIAMAKDFVVGDERGWKLGVDYQYWAANKVFRVGDTLSKLITFLFFISNFVAKYFETKTITFFL